MKHIDSISEILKYCKKREEVLKEGLPISKYNKYYDKIRKYEQKIFEEERQNELVPFLYSDSISIRSDIACILYHYYPEKCTEVLKEIADMTVDNGLPKCFVILSIAAKDNLKYGIPKNCP